MANYLQQSCSGVAADRRRTNCSLSRRIKVVGFCTLHGLRRYEPWRQGDGLRHFHRAEYSRIPRWSPGFSRQIVSTSASWCSCNGGDLLEGDKSPTTARGGDKMLRRYEVSRQVYLLVAGATLFLAALTALPPAQAQTLTAGSSLGIRRGSFVGRTRVTLRQKGTEPVPLPISPSAPARNPRTSARRRGPTSRPGSWDCRPCRSVRRGNG